MKIYRKSTGSDSHKKQNFFKSLAPKTIVGGIIRLFALILAVLAFLFVYYAKDLPDPNKLLSRDVAQSTKIYARDGTTLLYEVHGEYKRTLIPFSEMNSNIKNATIAIEDKNFYNEGGIDLRGILRSIFVDITTLGKAQGGSTITQQFVRNAILSREKTFSRKIKEIILSLEINSRFSKDDILKLYLNEIPYGRNTYGIEAAAEAYYGIHAQDLDLAQAAYLASLPQSPTYYNPLGAHRADLDTRKNTVLDQMLAQGYINKQQHDQAKSEQVIFQKNHDLIVAPHFVLYVEDYLSQKYGDSALQTGGMTVITTLDPKLQDIAEKVVAAQVPINQKKYNANNAALVAEDPHTGQILAMVGSKNYFGDPEPAGCKPGLNCTFEPNVNVALSQRQPGSSVKPYIYATAFKPDYKESPATMRMDVLTNFGTYQGKPYIPENYNKQTYGPVSIRQALAGSLNIPAVKTLFLVGVDNAVKTMHDFGITSPLQDCGLSLTLGGCEVRLIDHVNGYATIATEGTHHQQAFILKVQDSNGNILEQYQDNSSNVLDPQAAYELINIMTDTQARVFTFGSTAQILTLPDRPVAAKTGTTQNFHDGWTLGFTPSLVAGVWAGNNDGTLMKQDAVIVAGPIWQQFMQQATAGTPSEAFTEPDGIQNVTVDAVSGKLPTQYTKETKNEVFASYAVPTAYDDVHVAVAVGNPQLCSGVVSCPNPQTQVYTILHSERPDLPNWEDPVEAWALANGYTYPPQGSTIIGGTPVGGSGSNNSSGSSNGSSGSGSSNGGGQTVNPGNPPVANIISPADGSTVLQPFSLNASGTPDNGNTITRIDLLIDGVISSSSQSSPASFPISQLQPGQHTFAVHVVDDKGNTDDTSITLKVK